MSDEPGLVGIDVRIRYSPDGVPLGKEKGDPGDHLRDDPEFEARFQARLVEIGRRFGLHGQPTAKPRSDARTPSTAPAGQPKV